MVGFFDSFEDFVVIGVVSIAIFTMAWFSFLTLISWGVDNAVGQHLKDIKSAMKDLSADLERINDSLKALNK